MKPDTLDEILLLLPLQDASNRTDDNFRSFGRYHGSTLTYSKCLFKKTNEVTVTSLK